MTVPHIEYDGKYPYRYNGKELDQMHRLDLYDYSARYYDQAIGRFTTVDPLSEKYYSWSPYNYVGNNPIKRVDPDGKDWIDRIVGVGIGVVTNNYPGSTSIRDLYTPNDASDYNGALQIIDNTAMAVGAVMIVAGGFEMAAGSGAAGAGGIIAASGVGSPVGGLVAGAGGTTIAAGGAEIIGGTVLLGNAYLNKQGGYNYGRVSEASSLKGGKPLDIKTGQKLGPSGKPMVHTVRKSTLKQAKDAAKYDRSNGAKKGKVKHTKDKKGGPHFHNGSGPEGKGKGTKDYGTKSGKISNNVHYGYPD